MKPTSRMYIRLHRFATVVAVVALLVAATAWIFSEFASLKLSNGSYGAPRPRAISDEPRAGRASLSLSSLWILKGEYHMTYAAYPDVIKPHADDPDSDAGFHADLTSTPVIPTPRNAGDLWSYKHLGDWQFLGIQVWTGPSRAEHAFLLAIPCWLVTFPALLASIFLVRPYWIASRRVLAHCCASCGYDRTGLPKTAACPECNNTPPLRSEGHPSIP
jgi:hypothetical protein